MASQLPPDRTAPADGPRSALSAERVKLTKAQRRVLALAAGHVDGRVYAQGRHISVCRALHAKNLISYAGMGHTCTIYHITAAGRAALAGEPS